VVERRERGCRAAFLADDISWCDIIDVVARVMDGYVADPLDSLPTWSQRCDRASARHGILNNSHGFEPETVGPDHPSRRHRRLRGVAHVVGRWALPLVIFAIIFIVMATSSSLHHGQARGDEGH